MATTPLAKKLQLKPGQRALFLNAPDGYVESLGELPDGVKVLRRPSGTVDFVQLFVRNREDFEGRIDQALNAVERHGLLWVSYPKGSSKLKTDVNRDILWALMKERGFEGVFMVSVDATWSAMRFRPAELVGT
jgi:hypothetical protein